VDLSRQRRSSSAEAAPGAARDVAVLATARRYGDLTLARFTADA
jgi:hypothetical protein